MFCLGVSPGGQNGTVLRNFSDFPLSGCFQTQLRGMQYQVFKCPSRTLGIKRIARNRVIQCYHMHPQLMAAPGLR